LQVFAELFAVHVARRTETRGRQGGAYGGVAGTALQPLLEGRI
jgi:hypothetical protein